MWESSGTRGTRAPRSCRGCRAIGRAILQGITLQTQECGAPVARNACAMVAYGIPLLNWSNLPAAKSASVFEIAFCSCATSADLPDLHRRKSARFPTVLFGALVRNADTMRRAALLGHKAPGDARTPSPSLRSKWERRDAPTLHPRLMHLRSRLQGFWPIDNGLHRLYSATC